VKLTRRHLLAGAPIVGAGALYFGTRGLLGRFGTHSPREGVLGSFERLNLRAQATLFRGGSRLDFDPDDETMEDAWPTYMAAPSLPVAPANYKLRVGGMCERPREFTVDDILRMDRVTYTNEHHCVEGWSARATWSGVPVSKIAEMCGAKSVDWVEFKSFDKTAHGERYWSTWDYDSAMHPQTLIAYGMNNHLLSPEHGAPLKLYGAVKLGYKQVKWLDEINFVDKVDGDGGYWEARSYELFGGT
jgi:DMSO/TMAO reductase YedYZ molybdopterin-dependent catalytic subunit